MAGAARVRIRRGTTSQWEIANPILLIGEPGAVIGDPNTDSDVGKMKIGNGVNAWKDLPFSVGQKGSKGDQGIQGIQGAQGLKGDQGDQGVQGPIGPQGIQGKGFKISKIYSSVALLTADTNPVGIVSGEFAIINTGNVNDVDNAKIYLWDGVSYTFTVDLSGQDGIVGPQGPQGPQGVQGIQGEQGDQGIQGIQGPAGSQGLTGLPGLNGSNGESAYQTWLDLGNIGTEANFIASLKGERGDKGDPGAGGTGTGGGIVSTIKRQSFTTTEGQTLFTLTEGAYTPNTRTISLYVYGQKQDGTAIVESSPTEVILKAALPTGTFVLFEWYEDLGVTVLSKHASDHITGGIDVIPDSTDATSGLMSAEYHSRLKNVPAITSMGSKGSSMAVSRDDHYHESNIEKQAIINGNFDVWQRGVSFNYNAMMSFAFTADRWKYDHGASSYPNVIISKNVLSNNELSGSKNSIRLNYTTGGSSVVYSRLCTSLENIPKYFEGKTVTCSFKAKSNIAKKIGIYFEHYYGTGGSPSGCDPVPGKYFNLTTSWQTYSFTFTMPSTVGKTFGTNNDDILMIQFWTAWNQGYSNLFGDTVAEVIPNGVIIDIAQVQLNAGGTALPFSPKSFNDELLVCMRYYERSGSYNDFTIDFCSSGNLTNWLLHSPNVYFKVQKRTTPSVSIFAIDGSVNKLSEYNAGSAFVANRGVAVNLSGKNSMYVQSDGTMTAGNYVRWHWTADAEL